MERLSGLQQTSKNNGDKELMESYAILMKNLCKEIWPFLAVVGNIAPGFRLGGECTFAKTSKGIITDFPQKSDSPNVRIQEVFDDGTDKMEET